MAGVFNWQLGRPMDYPHEERHPKWQFAFVFNPNRCIGCQTCTMACKSTWTFSKGQELMWWNNVESKPYGGYPQHWDAKLLGMLEEANPGGQVWNTTEKEPSQKPYGTFQGKTIFEAAEKNVGPEGRRGRSAICRPTTSGGIRTFTKTRRLAICFKKTASTAAQPHCPSIKSGSSIWPAFAITARIPAASPRARETRSTSGPKTASC